MIKYIGSKRRLVPVLGSLLSAAGARTALDLFTGTTRVAQEWKRRGAHVTAVDLCRCGATLAECYISLDADAVDLARLDAVLEALQSVPGREGYFTRTFSRAARYFQEHNARRIDAIRDEIEQRWGCDPLRPALLVSLLEAADRVDSTTGLQMAFLKDWAPRSYQSLELRRPVLLPGPGTAIQGDATTVAGALAAVDLAYLDPPYNQHRYDANYHVWETLIAWDRPEHYGVACKRSDLRGPEAGSPFNRRRLAPRALEVIMRDVAADVLAVSCSDDGWIGLDDIVDVAASRGHTRVLAYESKRYVGAQIGIHNPRGERVGTVGRTRNTEYIVLAGPRAVIGRMTRGQPVLRRSSLRSAAAVV